MLLFCYVDQKLNFDSWNHIKLQKVFVLSKVNLSDDVFISGIQLSVKSFLMGQAVKVIQDQAQFQLMSFVTIVPVRVLFSPSYY